jgi:cell division protein FtsB
MPSARSSAARSAPIQPERRTAPQRPVTQPRGVKAHGGPLSRIRWDRASRVAMVVVLMIIGGLWISGISSLFSHHAQAERGLAQVHRLAAQNKALLAEEKALHQRATILDRARDLGMVQKGEQSFIVTH